MLIRQLDCFDEANGRIINKTVAAVAFELPKASQKSANSAAASSQRIHIEAFCANLPISIIAANEDLVTFSDPDTIFIMARIHCGLF